MTAIGSDKVTPEAFYRAVRERFHVAQERLTTHEFWYRVAGFVIKLTFAGDDLLPIVTPALSHLRTKPSRVEPALHVLLWDAASSDVNLPDRPWGPDDNISRGDIRDFGDANIRTAYTLGPNALSVWDTRTSVALFCTTSAAHIPTDYRGSPLLVILSWWMSSRGLQYVHAGAVGTAEGGVLLVGKGGSGKSTSSLSCIDSELSYVSDDYCLVDLRDGDPFVHSIYNSAKLVAGHLRNFPHLVPYISNPEHLSTAKAVIYLQDHRPDKLIHGFPIKAILIPRITGLRDTEITPASALAGLKALAPSTLFQLSGADAKNFGFMADFVRRVPCRYLDAGTDLDQIPVAIQRFLSLG